ncbi:MAG TPA: hypothetical protein VIB01_01740 [Steroidobacteraceae bacterium]
MATTSAIAMSLDEASRYFPDGWKVMSADRMASTGSTIRNTP